VIYRKPGIFDLTEMRREALWLSVEGLQTEGTAQAKARKKWQ
jgi:hypothetical protein